MAIVASRGQHRDDRVDVGTLPGVDVAADDIPQRRVAERPQRGLLALLGEPFVDRLVGTLAARFDTDAGVVSSTRATSAPEKPSTSRRISTARWRGGSSWSAAMNASSTLSRSS